MSTFFALTSRASHASKNAAGHFYMISLHDLKWSEDVMNFLNVRGLRFQLHAGVSLQLCMGVQTFSWGLLLVVFISKLGYIKVTTIYM